MCLVVSPPHNVASKRPAAYFNYKYEKEKEDNYDNKHKDHKDDHHKNHHKDLKPTKFQFFSFLLFMLVFAHLNRLKGLLYMEFILTFQA